MEQRGDENGRAEHGKHMLNAQRDCLPSGGRSLTWMIFFMYSPLFFCLHSAGITPAKLPLFSQKLKKKAHFAAGTPQRSELSYAILLSFER